MNAGFSPFAVALMGSILLSAPPGFAHHSEVVHYDLDTEIFHEDVTVLEWRFVNPHAQLIYEAPDRDGKPTQWIGNSDNITHLRRLGLTATSLEPGQVVTVRGHPRRDGRPEMEVIVIRRSDGWELSVDPNTGPELLSGAPTGPVGVAAAPTVEPTLRVARDFAGVWENVPGPVPPDLIEALVPDGAVFWIASGQGPEEARGETGVLSLTDKAQTFLDNWTPGYDECRPYSSWMTMTAPYLHGFSEERGQRIQIRHEYMDLERTIWLDGRGRGRPGLDRLPRTVEGYSVGHWEGDTLVVETTHMLAGAVTRNGIYHSENAVMTEWISREDQTLIILRVLEDPEHFEQPIASILLKSLSPYTEVTPYGECVPQQSEAR